MADTGKTIALIKALSGGGGSGGDGSILIVSATFAYENEEWSVTLDKTFAEISAAASADKIVLCIPYESANGFSGYPCVMTVESNEAFATTDVNVESIVYEFDFGIDSNDDTYVTATTWSKSGSGGVLVATDTDGTLDKTWQEINDADFAVVLAHRSGIGAIVHMPVNYCNEEKDTYAVACLLQGATVYYTAESASDYPTLDE